MPPRAVRQTCAARSGPWGRSRGGTAPILGLALAALVALAVAPAAVADEGAGRTVIVGDRSPSAPFDSARAVHVVTREAIEERAPEDAPGALEGTPGVFVQRTQRGAAAPIMRGLVGPQNLILIDGLRFNTSIFRTGPNQYAALMDPGLLDGVEVLLGPGAALYGSDAMGGAISYLSRAAPTAEGWAGDLELGGASADRAIDAAGRVALGGARGGGWVRGAVTVRDELRAGGGEVQLGTAYTRASWATRWEWRPEDDLRLGAAYIGGATLDAIRTDALPRGDVRVHDNVDHFAWARLEARLHGFLRHADVALYAHHLVDAVAGHRCALDGEGAVLDAFGCATRASDVVTRQSRHRDAVTALGLSARVVARALADRLELRAGLDAHHEWIASGRPDAPEERGNFSDGSTWGTGGLYALVEGRPYLDPGVAELVVTGVIRGDVVFAAAPEVPGLGDVRYEHVGLVGGGSVRALLGYRLNLHAGVWQGFRAPNLQETTVLGDTGQTFEVPNADLGPERATTLEVGARVRAPELDVAVTAYRTALSDAIVREDAQWQGASQVDGKDVVRRVNATRASYQGVEVSAAVRPLPVLTFGAAIAFTEGEVETAGGGREAPRRLPPVQGVVRAGWQVTPAIRLAADVTWAAAQAQLAPGDRADHRICGDPDAPHRLLDSCPGTPGWARVGVSAIWQALPDLSLRLRVDNVLDARYRVHGSGYDAAGVNARLVAHYRI